MRLNPGRFSNPEYATADNDYSVGELLNITDFEYPRRAEQSALEYFSWVNSCMPIDSDMVKLRTRVLSEMGQDRAQRIKNRPVKTDFEEYLGVYIEEIEPQVRAAVVTLHNKGYATFESGFAFGGAVQALAGRFLLDEDTRHLLNEAGAFVFSRPTEHETMIAYPPAAADISYMTAVWDNIADLLPNKY